MTPKRVALVSGANRGIGLEIARQLTEHGVHVLLGSRNLERGAVAAAKLTGAVEPIALDVADNASVRAVAKQIAERLGGLDILVNNAGVGLDGFNAEVARRTMDVNYYGAARLTDALLPHMRFGGRVVMVSSGMGELSCLSRDLQERFTDPSLDRSRLDELVETFVADVGAGGHEIKGWPASAYRVSKVALNALTRIMARDLERQGNPKALACNAACPGWVRTDMGGSMAPRSAREGADTPVFLALQEDVAPSGGFFRDRAPAPW